MEFRLTFHDTSSHNKFEAERRFEYLGNRNAIWELWHLLFTMGKPHVEVFNLAGELQHPDQGIAGLKRHPL